MATNHMRTVAGPSIFPRGLSAAVLLVCAGTALAQPAGVTVTDLGSFVSTASTVQTRNLTLTTAAPAAWFKIRLPRVADPHRYLDISTSGGGFGDTELGIYASTGVLIATDDDDGAQNYSALSFGITSPSAAGRVPPVADAGQTPGEPNNGRDGTLSAAPFAPGNLLGTAADYYIAVTRFDASFGNSFGVIPPAGPASDFQLLLTVRMNTPGGQVAPTVAGFPILKAFGDSEIRAEAATSPGTTGVTVDVSAVGGGASVPLTYFASTNAWAALIGVPSLTQPGDFPIIYRATNALGDVTADQRILTVGQLADECTLANNRLLSVNPGTTVSTYDTTLGNIDGPWTSACFNPAQPPTGNDVWFRFLPTRSGSLTLSTCNSDTGAIGAQPDTLLGIRSDCTSAFSACGDDVGGCGLGTRLSNIPVTAGQVYNIAVRSWSGDITGGRLAVTFVPTGCGPSDVAGPNQSIGSDGVLTADDIIVFLGWFFAGDSRANVAGANQSTVPDNTFTADDIIVFLGRYFGGC